MVFIVGLGNPGQEYAQTRHNVGWIVLDQLAATLGAPAFTFHKKFNAEISKIGTYYLIKPQTFMNDSGQAVRAIMEFYGEAKAPTYDNLIVIHDDLDLVLGQYKLQLGKGPKIHNGLLSLYTHLHTPGFWHARIGVDSRGGDRSMPGRSYVLQKLTKAELKTLSTETEVLIQELRSKMEQGR